MPPSMRISVSRGTSAGTGLGVQRGDMLIAQQAGVGARFEANLRCCVGGEALARLHHQRTVEVVGLFPSGNVQFAIRIEVGLECRSPHLGGDGTRCHFE